MAEHARIKKYNVRNLGFSQTNDIPGTMESLNAKKIEF